MKKRIALVLYYNKYNKYSFNALIGALEQDKLVDVLEVFFIAKRYELIDRLGEIISTHDQVVLAISFFTTQLWEINEFIKLIRQRFANKILIIAGGPHPTGDPKGTLKMGVDVVVLGEGEETFIELMQKINNGEPFLNIKGIGILKDDKEYLFTGKRIKIDLNKYAPFPVIYRKKGPIEITRGCPHACSFCQTSHIFGTLPRHRNIESIIKYVKMMKEEGLGHIRFVTPNAFSYGSLDGKTLNLRKLEELLSKVKNIIPPEGKIFLGSFPSEVRPEHVNEETIGLLLKYASNDNIVIGAQSGSQKILDRCNRAHTIEDIRSAVTLTVKSGLKAYVDFIFGLPGEDKEDIKQTIYLMEHLAKIGAKIHTHSFIPLPTTAFAMNPVHRIDKELLKAINILTAKGKSFGTWEAQEKIAKKVSRYLRTNELV